MAFTAENGARGENGPRENAPATIARMETRPGTDDADHAAAQPDPPEMDVGVAVEAKPSDALKPAPPPLPSPESLAPLIEALLLSVDRPLSSTRIGEVLAALPLGEQADASPDPRTGSGARSGAPGSSRERPIPNKLIVSAVEVLNAQLGQTGRAFRIESLAGGYRVMTLPRFARVIETFHGKRERHALSRAAVETLAIIAYKQPITRATLEAIRGVSCGEVLRSLIERRLVTVAGRAEEVGRPILYATTRQFLETFGLASLKDLPSAADLALQKAQQPD